MFPCVPGLCGNFNNIMTDDFKVNSGLVEGTAAAFANTWKTRASCPDITTRFRHPCSQDINRGRDLEKPLPVTSCHTSQKMPSKLQRTRICSDISWFLCACVLESYAQYWCSKLTDPQGVFSPCHSVISPNMYKDVGLHTQSFDLKKKQQKL